MQVWPAAEPPALFSTLNDAWERAATALRFAALGDRPNRLLQIAPRPLIHPDARMIVIFSAKSACSSVVIWFLHHLGLAEEARAYNAWPHRYRMNVFYKSRQYRDARYLDLADFRIVRVVRDPFERVASSFRHALYTAVADADFARLLGRTDIAETGASFCEFLDLLERLNLATCDVHFRLQRHPIEDRLPVTHLVNVSTEDLFARLNQVESDIGLPVTDFGRLQWLADLDRARTRFDARRIDTDDAYDLRLTRPQAHRGPWPASSALLTPLARERIARLYAADVAAYGRLAGPLPVRARFRPAAPVPQQRSRAERRALRRKRRRRQRRQGGEKPS